MLKNPVGLSTFDAAFMTIISLSYSPKPRCLLRLPHDAYCGCGTVWFCSRDRSMNLSKYQR